MMHEIKRHIQEIFALVTNKYELDQIVFDIAHLSDKFSYKTIADNNEDNSYRIQQIRNEISKIGSTLLQSYLYSLTDHNDLWLFEPTHFKNFMQQFEERVQKTDVFQITVAIQLKDEDVRRIASRLSQTMEKTVIIDVRTNSNLIGGAIIKKDNYILDYSLKTKLTNLSEHWKNSILKASKK